jgi:hypothetical protein
MSLAWKSFLKIDPLPTLLAPQDPALRFFVRRDLLGEVSPPAEVLWELPEPTLISRKQQENGSWQYPKRTNHPAAEANYNLLETYRCLRILVEMFGFDNRNPTLSRAAEYIFQCQSVEGDIRGILGNQYMPYYHAAILELMIKSGYAHDVRTEKGLQWLLSMRQDDGGWIIPAQLVPAKEKTSRLWTGSPILPERSRPHAHLATGMILRAFAAHPDYCRIPEVHSAGERLKVRFFEPDKYNDRKAVSYWLKFQFPFWWPNLLTALDSLGRLGFNRRDRDIARGLDWFTLNQSEDGLWETGYGSGKNARRMRHWVGLAICRIMRAFFE